MPETNSEQANEVKTVVEGLMTKVDADELQEVESAQPESLQQFEAKDAQGNEITYIRNNAGHLETTIEVRDAVGKLLAQSWDGKEWSVGRFGDEVPHITLDREAQA